ARRAVIEVVRAVVSALSVLWAGLVLRVVVVVFGPVDFPVDRELPRLGAPFLTVMALRVVASTTRITAAPHPRWGNSVLPRLSHGYMLRRSTEESSPEMVRFTTSRPRSHITISPTPPEIRTTASPSGETPGLSLMTIRLKPSGSMITGRSALIARPATS